MYAVIKTGGKQYRVAADDVITIEKIAGEAGSKVEFAEVLMIGGDSPKFGSPLVSGAKVVGEFVEATRGPKVIDFKKRRRKNSRRKRGYRHDYTVIRITEILTDGQKPSKVAKPRPEPKPKAKPAEGEEGETKAAKGKAPAKKAAAKKPGKAPAKKAAKPAAKGGKKK